MQDSILLPLLLAVPLLGAIVGALLNSAKAARAWAMVISIATAAVSVAMLAQMDLWQQPANLEQTIQLAWGGPPAISGQMPDSPFTVAGIHLTLRLGVDTISLWLVLLTTLLTPLAIAASFESIRDRAKEYYAWMLLLLAAMLGVFVARDLLLFYIFFELTLIPMFFIIGIWGGPQRRYAAGKFFLFTFAGSVFTLAAVIYLGLKYATFDMRLLVESVQTGSQSLGGVVARMVPPLSGTERFWIMAGLLAGFAVKVPLFPVHTWLPLAHTEAPTAGSVILAGVLLKLGTYGLLRLAVPIGLIGVDLDAVAVTGHLIPFTGVGRFDITMRGVLWFLAIMCLIGIIYGALVAWVQQDIKKLVAYSSVSHLGFCVLGLVALNTIGIQGSIMYMINHGISTGALFLVIGMIYDRYHTRDINELSGLARKMPRLAFFFVLFALSSIGLPGLNGFVSEFLTILGAFTSQELGIRFGVIAALGVILGAIYMLHMTARVIWGPLKTPLDAGHHHGHGHHQENQGQAASPGHDHAPLPADIGAREISVLAPLALAVVLLGVLPSPVLRSMLAPVELMQNPVRMTMPQGVASDDSGMGVSPVRPPL